MLILLVNHGKKNRKGQILAKTTIVWNCDIPHFKGHYMVVEMGYVSFPNYCGLGGNQWEHD